MVPIVNGHQLKQALGNPKGGPWMTKAMEMVIRWQLRNPDNRSEDDAVAEVLRRKKELGLGGEQVYAGAAGSAVLPSVPVEP